MALRTAYLAAEYRDLDRQIAHAIRDSRTVLVYGTPAQQARVAAALLAAERTLHRSLHVTHEHDRWVIAR
jgi:hypothetical protein